MPVPRSLSDEIGLSFWDARHERPAIAPQPPHRVQPHPAREVARAAGAAGQGGGRLRTLPAAGRSGGDRHGCSRSQDDPDYRALLAMCEAGRRRLDEIKRFDMPGFRPRPEYVREMKRYGVLPASFDASSDPIDVYAVERRYWDLFGWKPSLRPQ